jgi:hypothetical protein
MTNSTKNRKNRAKKGTQEFFTPEDFVKIMIDNCPDEFFSNGEIFHESCCGNGNIIELVYNRYRKFHDHHLSLSFIYAYDLMQDNVIETIKRLYGHGEIKELKGDNIPIHMRSTGLIAMFEYDGKLIENIVCADGNTYKMNYGKKLKPNIFGNNLFEQAS